MVRGRRPRLLVHFVGGDVAAHGHQVEHQQVDQRHQALARSMARRVSRCCTRATDGGTGSTAYHRDKQADGSPQQIRRQTLPKCFAER